MKTIEPIDFESIHDQLERAKHNLKGLNENIRRISGREPPDALLRGDRKRNFSGLDTRRSGTERLSGTNSDYKAEWNRNHERPQIKRRHIIEPESKSVFSRLSGPPIRGGGGGGGGGNGGGAVSGGVLNADDEHKPKLNSRIIREMPSRQEIVEAQGTDAASKARNRRMFGSLLGTLQKFCQEESRLKLREDRKAQIEKKLEDQQTQEREDMKRERQVLFMNRKKQQMEIKVLELKMNRIKELTAWEDSQKTLMNFVKTKTKPKIFYLPKVMDKKTQKKLSDCKFDIEKSITKKRNEVNEELIVIQNRYKITDLTVPNSNINNTDGLSEQHNLDETSTKSKHDRRSSQHDEEDDDDDDDVNDDYEDLSIIEQSEQHNIQPDISIVKKEAITIINLDTRSEIENNRSIKITITNDLDSSNQNSSNNTISNINSNSTDDNNQQPTFEQDITDEKPNLSDLPLVIKSTEIKDETNNKVDK